jgi:hypothetical protein
VPSWHGRDGSPGSSARTNSPENGAPPPVPLRARTSTPHRGAYDAVVTVVCDGLLVESDDGAGECDQGEACQALALRRDYEAYRAAHGRVIAGGQAENKDEYGGEA